MSSIRMGIIGCGNFMSMGHIGNLLAMPEVEIVGLADTEIGSIQRTKERYPQLENIAVFSDHDTLLSQAKPDAVEIATPHSFHAQHIQDAFAAGCHVLVEKPLVISSVEAEAVLAKRDAAGKVLVVSYQRRYTPQFRYVRDAVQSGALGELQFVAAVLSQGWLEFTDSTWRQTPEISGGGMLLDTGSHLLDFLLYSTGLEIARLKAYSRNLGSPVDINSTIAIEFKSGCLGSLSVVGHASRSVVEDLDFFGSKGALSLESNWSSKGSKARIRQEIYGEGDVDTSNLPAESTPDANFVDAILGRAEVASPGEAGLNVVRLTEAIHRSIEEGVEVELA